MPTCKKAFTMLELVFVLIVIGVLSAAFLPRLQHNRLMEAATQIVSHIKYTQHLAMVNDKYNGNIPQWYRERWQIFFSTAHQSISYVVFSEHLSSHNAYDGNPGANSDYTKVEVAHNPLNPDRYLIGVKFGSFNNSDDKKLTANMNLTAHYNIKNMKMTGGGSGSSSRRILFDHVGRPIRGGTSSTNAGSISGAYDKYVVSPIYIKLCIEECHGNNQQAYNENEIVIKVENESGFTCILDPNTNNCM